MSISSEITRITSNIAAAFNAVKSMGGKYTSTKSDDLAAAILTIPGASSTPLPTEFQAIAMGTHTLSANSMGSATFNVTHNLGVVPDMFLFYTPKNIATTYSMLYAFRSPQFGYRGTTYLTLCGYHANSTTTVTATNVTTSYGIKTLTATTATITSYSTSSSYGWRAGTYNWIAIKFAS